MKRVLTPLLLAFATLLCAAPAAQLPQREILGKVSFAVSCNAKSQIAFNRGVALLHDFWYPEARLQFERILKTDAGCAMAHWGIAMSVFHQIWDRPDEKTAVLGAREMQAARAHPAQSARERAYVAALSEFYRPDKVDYEKRIDRYAAAMGTLYTHYPRDTDAGAFYALSLLAAESPSDTSLAQEHKAMAVLGPLFEKFPDHPGVVHYIIHACDTPSLAADGLAAARRYGEIAASGPHAVHMPGHIFARLGMWQPDIEANTASVAASQAAQARHQSGAMDQFHSYDFLLYAYLQSGQDDRAHAVLEDTAMILARFQNMPAMGEDYMTGMLPYYRSKYPIFYALEMRDWAAAAMLEPVSGAPPESQTLTYWARTIAAGHLRQPAQAHANLTHYRSLTEEIRKGRHAYFADSTAAQIALGEMQGWVAFAEGNPAEAIGHMRQAADLQDKVGQGEVDIPAREMLADIMLESGDAQAALVEYALALKSSPNRFNGLSNAGRAAEAAGDRVSAQDYYARLLTSTDHGSHSSRAQIQHAKNFQAQARTPGS